MAIISMLSYWNETLKNISQDQRKDNFVFTINNKTVKVPLSLALGISPFITEQYLKEPTIREFKIEIKDKDNDDDMIEEEFSDFLKGKKIRKETFFKFGTILKKKEMIQMWKKSYELTNERVINYLKCLSEMKENKINNMDNKSNNIEKESIEDNDSSEEIEYIRQHLEDMKEEIKELSIETLFYIMRIDNLLVKSEDTI